MLTYPQIDPVAIQLGPLKIHWYGLMYIIGFTGAWWLARVRCKREESPYNKAQIDDLIFYVALGCVVGGRIGYVLFYNFSVFLETPLMLFKVWEGGMSFHGGLIGAFLAQWLLTRRLKIGLFDSTDFVAPLVPFGLLFGRIGNFINGELWGKPSDLPWAMVFPGAGPSPRHPSQLYEAFLEGILLFLILWFFTAKTRPRMAATGMALLFYGLFRFAVEFFRLPDAHLGYIAFDWLTMGQILTLPMVAVGGLFLLLAYRR